MMVDITSFLETESGIQVLMAGLLFGGIAMIYRDPRYKKTKGIDIIAFTAIYTFIASQLYHLIFGQLDGYTGFDTYGGAPQQIILLIIFTFAYIQKFPKVLAYKRSEHTYTLGLVCLAIFIWILVITDIIPVAATLPMGFRELWVTYTMITIGIMILLNYFFFKMKR